MSSLRRILSIDSTNGVLLVPHHSDRPKIARHSSLPILTLFNKPQYGFPLPNCRSRVGGRRDESLPSSPIVLCCYRTGGNLDDHHASGCPVPAWLARGGAKPKKKNMDVEESIVYRQLRDSIPMLEVEPPNRYVCLMSPQPGLTALQADERKHLNDRDVRGRPLSLRMLKRKGQRTRQQVRSPSPTQLNFMEAGQIPPVSSRSQAMKSLLSDNGVPVNSAFTSMVFMMESLQQHTLWLKRTLMSEADACLHDMLSKVQAEMQETFLWLFQKVFACTPKLMLLTMMLLVDFTAHSMGMHAALAVMPMGEPPTAGIERPVAAANCTFEKYFMLKDVSTQPGTWIFRKSNERMTKDGTSFEPRLEEGGEGNGAAKILKIGGDMDGDILPTSFLDRTVMSEEEDSYGGGFNKGAPCNYCIVQSEEEDEGFPDLGACGSAFNEDYQVLNAMWKQVKGSSRRHGVVSRHMLVAPVKAPELEADDYACYDRTHLNYQHELSADPANPLLLANYAHFLHVVRHDHDRADQLYKRAVRADPIDGEVMGKYASFLWVAKEDVEAADEAYRAAMAADPSNAYHAGSYANFLWNCGPGEEDASLPYHHTTKSRILNQ